MANLKIAATERSPEIDFDFGRGLLAMRGESYPEDAASFFGPILGTLRQHLETLAAGRELGFDLEMIYFNSSSAKALMNMFLMLENAATAGASITINWIFAADDDTMREFGEDFSEDLQAVTFNLVAKTEG